MGLFLLEYGAKEFVICFGRLLYFFYEERYRLVGQVGGYHRCGEFLLSWGPKTLHFLAIYFTFSTYIYLAIIFVTDNRFFGVFLILGLF